MILPTLHNIQKFLHKKGYEVIALRDGLGFVCHIYKGEECLHEGKKVYKTAPKCQEDSYVKLYMHLNGIEFKQTA